MCIRDRSEGGRRARCGGLAGDPLGPGPALSCLAELTASTVSRQISAWKKDGVTTLEGNRHFSIPDMDRLLEEAGDDSDGGMLV